MVVRGRRHGQHGERVSEGSSGRGSLKACSTRTTGASTMARKPVNVERDRQIAELRRTGAASLEEIAKRVRDLHRARAPDHSSAPASATPTLPPPTLRRARSEKLDAAEDSTRRRSSCAGSGPRASRRSPRTSASPIAAAQAILDEQVTDEIHAARLREHDRESASRMPRSARAPDGDARDDRHWTYDATLAALVRCAEENGGRLPSSTKYKVIGSERDDMPSFPTVRNRIGRWSQVRILVNNKLKSNN
jgi:hypothetical protein